MSLSDDQNAQFIADVIEFVKDIIQSPDKDIWLVGGADINLHILKCRNVR